MSGKKERYFDMIFMISFVLQGFQRFDQHLNGIVGRQNEGDNHHSSYEEKVGRSLKREL